MTLNGATIDRRQQLLAPGVSFNGIDYVEVATADQKTLRVHFLNTVAVAGTLGSAAGSPPTSGAAHAVTITGGEVIGSVAVLAIDEATDWSVDDEARPVLTVRVGAPGDFSSYLLSIVSPVLDPFFASARFSFKAGCPSDFDCRPATAPCPPPEALDVPIDYLAKDFRSFVQALSEFSTQRYPAWLERSEADLGMVVMEVLAAAADELSYFQDRIAGESLLTTATQPVSLQHLARLVDYEPAPATVATVLLQLDVATGATTITTPVRCQALTAGGELIDFEVGHGLTDRATGELAALAYPVDARWNRGNLAPHVWDESQRCLPAGSTSLDIEGSGLGLKSGQQLLIDTTAATSADPPVREVVVIARDPHELSDPILGVEVTRVTLLSPTTEDHDLTRTHYAGNLVPATQGRRVTETFTIPGDTTTGGPQTTAAALVRLAANWTPTDAAPDYFYCLSSAPLAWIGATGSDTASDTARLAQPEIALLQDGGAAAPTPWRWARWLLDARPEEQAFTLTPEKYSPVLQAAGLTWFDYDGGEGTTVRFGDGTFGSRPAPGRTFTVLYRVGNGQAGNVPADAVTIVAAEPTPTPVINCTNPFPASGGTDAETPQQIRDRAPQAFRAKPLRVVRPADYAAAAQSLPWVQQAGTTFRWTGSWLTVLSAADPITTEQPTLPEVVELTDLLNRRRLAGYESYVLPPRYVSIDLRITLCANHSYFDADVEAAVLSALRPGRQPGGDVGFFDHTRWAFGAPLESSALLAAVQVCTGVDGVTEVLFRQRGVQSSWMPLPQTLHFGGDQILRVDDDPSRPEAGSLKVIVHGGKA
jgi:hypothetical protein